MNQDDLVQKAVADTNLAIGDLSEAIAFITNHPEAATAPPPTATRPDFTAPPRPAPNRNAGLEIGLNNLRTALDALGRASGGDLGDFRTKANAHIAAAASDIIAAINAANDDFRGRGRANAPPPQAQSPR